MITATANDGSGISASCTFTVTNNGCIVTDLNAFESSHDYTTDCTDFWIYTKTGAQGLKVTFDEQTYMEDEFDWLLIYDGEGNLIGEYTADQLAGAVVEIPGSTVKLQLQSDDSGTDWGFKVTAIESVDCVHQYTTVTIEPTCTEGGHTEYTCSLCGDSYIDNQVPALGHSSETVPGYAADCENAGLTDGAECSACGETLTAQEEIPALGHSYENGQCTNCGKKADLTGLRETAEGTFYYVEGVQSTHTGLLKTDGIWYYLKSGRWASELNQLAKYNGEWWYLVDGKVASTTTAMVELNGELWYVVKGKIAGNTTSLVKYDGIWYYVVKGKVAGNTTNLVKYNSTFVYNGKTYSIKGGKVV